MVIGNLRCQRVLRIEVFDDKRRISKQLDNAQLYPLRFDPIYQYRLWGGRRLCPACSPRRLPGDGPIGEAWVLSDRTDHQSLVANGPQKGRTLGRVMEQFARTVDG
jgi:mannose-6-phosphate isomerase